MHWNRFGTTLDHCFLYISVCNCWSLLSNRVNVLKYSSEPDGDNGHIFQDKT